MITFNAFCHMLTTEDQLRCLGSIQRHLLPGGLLAFDGSFPGLSWIGAPQDRRELEGETKHPRTGQTLRCYDICSFDAEGGRAGRGRRHDPHHPPLGVPRAVDVQGRDGAVSSS
jgi:hypothetical protein